MAIKKWREGSDKINFRYKEIKTKGTRLSKSSKFYFFEENIYEARLIGYTWGMEMLWKIEKSDIRYSKLLNKFRKKKTTPRYKILSRYEFLDWE